MNSSILYHLSLTFHIIGLTLMAGATVVDTLLFRQFWKQLDADRSKAIAVLQALAKIPRLFGIGIGLLILSGVGMMALTNGVFGEQLWFRIKFAFVILIIINGLAFGRRNGQKLAKLMKQDASAEQGAALAGIKTNISRFHIIQLAMFIIIFTLSVFKFN